MFDGNTGTAGDDGPATGLPRAYGGHPRLGSRWDRQAGVSGPRLHPPDPAGRGGDARRSSGVYLTAEGNDLSPTVNAVAVSGGNGLTLGSPQDITDNGMNVFYSVSSSPGSTGQYGITVTTTSGTSNQYNVTVGDPTPVITGISPGSQGNPPWQAGTTYSCGVNPIQITGTGFGTDPPGIAVSGAGVHFGVVCGGNTDSAASFSLTVDGTAQNGSATVTLTSAGYQGYNGNSYVSAGGGNSSSSVAMDAYVAAEPTPPAPTIMFGPVANGTVCANGTAQPASVVVGQKISFSGCLPAGVVASSETWTMDGRYQVNAVAGWTPTSAAATGAPTAVTAPNCGTAALCDVAPFYFIAPGAYTFNFSYVRASDGQGSPQVPVTINVTGPTATGAGGAFLTATVQSGALWSPRQIVNVFLETPAPPYLGMGNGIPPVSPGIVFSVAASPPAVANAQAQFQFVQLIASRRWRWSTNPATNDGGLGPSGPIPPQNPGLLDNWYPYVAATNNVNQAIDAPGVTLQVTANGSALPLGEADVAFAAAMYLMWDPAIPGPGQNACAPATNNPVNGVAQPLTSQCTGSIPVPLGYLTWGFNADAINTLQQGAGLGGTANFTGWVMVGCGGPSSPEGSVITSGSGYAVGSYPFWTQRATNGH